MRLPAFPVVMAALVSLLQTSNASNLRELSSNDEGQHTFNPPSKDRGVFSVQLRSDQEFLRTNPQKNQLDAETTLSGYLIFATYSDTACTSVILATATLLNKCIKYEISGVPTGYSMITATASNYTETFYSDIECRRVRRRGAPVNYSGRCTGLSSMYISSNSVPPSSSALVSSR